MDEPKEIGDWLLICVLGAGAFGKVTLWRNKTNEEHIAVKKCKFMLPSHLSSRQKERWINEVDIMKSLKNENIVAYKDLPAVLEATFSRHNPTHLPILSMEYCSKGNLRKFLLQTRNLKGCDEADVRCILRDVANGISYLHSRNITHRDIKPENIVIQDCNHRANRQIYKLIDLGYAKELETIASFVGTLPYLAPEIFYTQPYNSTVDYWSLGILTYEIITGVHPFLAHKSPVERFNCLKEKTDEDISISENKDGKVKFSTEILLANRLSPIFKRYIEDWLRLLLVFDSKRRGSYRGEKKHVFIELETILNKKMLKVFSVYNYRSLTYEITNSTKLQDLKLLIQRDTEISKENQLYVLDVETISDDNFDINNWHQENRQKSLYVFNRKGTFDDRTVNLPQQIQTLMQSKAISTEIHLKNLYAHAILFISKEKELIEEFDVALLQQINHIIFLFFKLKKLYTAVRQNLAKLNNQIECYTQCQQWCSQTVISSANKEYLTHLSNERTYLRQAKELTENFNSLTERFLKVLEKEAVTIYANNLKKALKSAEADMVQMYEAASGLYQKVTGSSKSTKEITQILSIVLKIPSQAIFRNEDLKKITRLSLSAQTKLCKLIIWSNALNEQINQVSIAIQNCQKDRYAYLETVPVPSIHQNHKSVRFPKNLEEDVISTEQLLTENTKLRYRIQEISNEGSAYLRNAQKDMFCLWNSIIVPTSQIE